MEIWDTGHLGKYEELEDSATAEAFPEGIPLSFIVSSRARDLLLPQAAVDGSREGGDALRYLSLDPRRFQVASVVPEELEHWRRRCPGISPISSQDALDGVRAYPTLGVDRALAARGAARIRGWPVMVVDCGSALTFTAADSGGRLAGGAILPGVRLQLCVLGTHTAQLPPDVVLPNELPPRWAMGTSRGIQAGVMWTIVAGIHSFIKDRWRIDPEATVIFTGGDGRVLHRAVLDAWEAEESDMARIRDRVKFVGEVIHWGVASVALGKDSKVEHDQSDGCRPI